MMDHLIHEVKARRRGFTGAKAHDLSGPRRFYAEMFSEGDVAKHDARHDARQATEQRRKALLARLKHARPAAVVGLLIEYIGEEQVTTAAELALKTTAAAARCRLRQRGRKRG